MFFTFYEILLCLPVAWHKACPCVSLASCVQLGRFISTLAALLVGKSLTGPPLIMAAKVLTFELTYDKINKMTCVPSEDSDQLSLHWAHSHFVLSLHWAHSHFVLSLHWAHSHFVGFVMKGLIYLACFLLISVCMLSSNMIQSVLVSLSFYLFFFTIWFLGLCLWVVWTFLF